MSSVSTSASGWPGAGPSGSRARRASIAASDDLELDHRDPTKKVSHRIWSSSWARIEAEAAKCDVRCHDCQRQQSAGEDGEEHGDTLAARGCVLG